MDLHGDHTATYTAHSGATKQHDWMVSTLGGLFVLGTGVINNNKTLFRTVGHMRTQHGVTASAGQRCGDVEIRNYLRDQAGSRNLVFDLSIAHNSYGSSSHVQQNVCYHIHRTLMALCVLLRSVKSTPIGNNTLTIRILFFSPP
jgi:hypothetical protein